MAHLSNLPHSSCKAAAPAWTLVLLNQFFCGRLSAISPTGQATVFQRRAVLGGRPHPALLRIIPTPRSASSLPLRHSWEPIGWFVHSLSNPRAPLSVQVGKVVSESCPQMLPFPPSQECSQRQGMGFSHPIFAAWAWPPTWTALNFREHASAILAAGSQAALSRG